MIRDRAPDQQACRLIRPSGPDATSEGPLHRLAKSLRHGIPKCGDLCIEVDRDALLNTGHGESVRQSDPRVRLSQRDRQQDVDALAAFEIGEDRTDVPEAEELGPSLCQLDLLRVTDLLRIGSSVPTPGNETFFEARLGGAGLVAIQKVPGDVIRTHDAETEARHIDRDRAVIPIREGEVEVAALLERGGGYERTSVSACRDDDPQLGAAQENETIGLQLHAAPRFVGGSPTIWLNGVIAISVSPWTAPGGTISV